MKLDFVVEYISNAAHPYNDHYGLWLNNQIIEYYKTRDLAEVTATRLKKIFLPEVEAAALSLGYRLIDKDVVR